MYDDKHLNNLMILVYVESHPIHFWCSGCKTIWKYYYGVHYPKATFEKIEYGVREQPNDYKHKLCPDEQ